MEDGSPTRVSVIVPTMNRPEMLRMALESIQRQRGADLELEIIVADNGLSDPTRVIAESYSAKYLAVAARGAAAARNAGMRHATGEFIAFLDDDDVWLEGHLRPHLNLMRESHGLVGAVGQVVIADKDLVRFGRPYPDSFDSARSFGHFLSNYPQIGATVVRRAALDRVGPMDERLLNGQDWDWHLRLALTGPIGFTGTPSLLFRQAEAGARRDLQWARLGYWWRVYLSNLRRAGGRWLAMNPGAIVAGTRHLGAFEGYFFQRGTEDLRRREFREALTDFSMALAASPAHFAKDLMIRRHS